MRRLGAALPLFLLTLGCGYSYYAEPMRPLPSQDPRLEVQDDGSVHYTQGRLEVRVRPMTADELNRRFSSASVSGVHSTNPYTYGDAERPEQESDDRFTVFLLSVKNYEYPKVYVDPRSIALYADNGREYWALDLLQLTNYYRAYSQGYRGNEYGRYRERTDLLNRTMFPKEMIFSGQELEGFLVFRSLHADVDNLTLTIHGAVTRFDYRDEPVERVDISYRFGREVGKLYPGGRREPMSASAS